VVCWFKISLGHGRTKTQSEQRISKMEQLLSALYAAGHKSFDLPIERLIAVLRVALTAFCFVVLTTTSGLQPNLIAPFALILATYGLFGLGVALLPTIAGFRTGWQLPVHLIDIGVISILVYFEKLSTAFFILFVFLLLSATYRWNWRGAFWTTVALLVVQMALFWRDGNPAILFIIRSTFLLVVGGVFVFVGISRERSDKRLAQIAAWPSIRMQAKNEMEHYWLDASLRHVASVFDARRVLVVWEVLQEPYSFVAYFGDGKFQQDRVVGDIVGNLVSTELKKLSFASSAINSNECFTADGVKHHEGSVVNDSIGTQYGISSMCSAPFSGDICNGRVFVLDGSNWRPEDLQLVEIAASRLRVELEYYTICIQLEDAAASRERIRLAHDLHDGVLQGLAAAGLQLSLVGSESGRVVKQKLKDVRKLLLGEQQRIRAFIARNQPSALTGHFNLHDELKQESEKMERQWGCSIQLAVTPRDATVPLELLSQIELLFAEATANAVQHGKASNIDIAAEGTPNGVKLRIANNGLGFKDLAGTFNQRELTARGIGPQSISKRVAELGGTLSLCSAPHRVELSIELPSHKQTVFKANEQAYALS
jgi:signal transduction histidine kinase